MKAHIVTLFLRHRRTKILEKHVYLALAQSEEVALKEALKAARFNQGKPHTRDYVHHEIHAYHEHWQAWKTAEGTASVGEYHQLKETLGTDLDTLVDTLTSDQPGNEGTEPAKIRPINHPGSPALHKNLKALLNYVPEGHVAWPCPECTTASMCKLNGVCRVSADRRATNL